MGSYTFISGLEVAVGIVPRFQPGLCLLWLKHKISSPFYFSYAARLICWLERMSLVRIRGLREILPFKTCLAKGLTVG